MTETKQNTVNSSASALGRLGGRAVVKKHGKAYMRNLGKKGAKARWDKKDKKSDGNNSPE